MVLLSPVAFVGLASLLPTVFAHPQGSGSALSARDDKFVFAAIGDSWGSGVQWSSDTQWDGNQDGCMRYKYAWSTVANDDYANWTPETNKEADFQFKACSGAHLGDNMKDQMDKTARPKLVLMEAGGNDAIFYPMADACLFKSNNSRTYGELYENDNDPENPKGECRKEILEVRKRVEGDNIKNLVVQTIDMWRSHPEVVDNDASLFLLGYARFFAPGLDSACNHWDFGVQYRNETQKVIEPLRAEFNEMVVTMNAGIKKAVDGYKDPKIQYIDVDPSFHGHHFCEEGQSKLAQYNWGSDVHFWNNPARVFITIKNNDGHATYDTETNNAIPQDLVLKLLDHPVEGQMYIQQDDQSVISNFQAPDDPEVTMEWRVEPQGSDSLNGRIARTLHPTYDGHKGIGDVVKEALKKHYRPG